MYKLFIGHENEFISDTITMAIVKNIFKIERFHNLVSV